MRFSINSVLRHVIYFHPRLLTIVPTHLPVMNFLMIDGSGDPNGEPFAQATEALYSFAYAVKMSYRSDDVPAGYYEYTVLTLEGVWDLVDWTKLPTDRTNLDEEPASLTESARLRTVLRFQVERR
ncbi:hypothetical protein [Paenibacillus contaminans]|uniref:hypothetical protein n=1 Tax=Paenibacillus contaminans TaxID=450362 RepID=UPI001864578E|nr:hypothetical protein [Paenibacillus contaminans]